VFYKEMNMPKVRWLGASMARGNAYNFYIRCDDDLDDQDTETDRGPAEYPHIHVRTTGASPWDDILYIGITFGGIRASIDIYDNGQYLLNRDTVVGHITAHCPGISGERVQPLTLYLFGHSPQVAHQ
jgi:hypothetical protein